MTQSNRYGRVYINIILLLSLLLNLYLFLRDSPRFIYDPNFEDTIKQGKVIYNSSQLIEHVRNKYLIPPFDMRTQNLKSNAMYHSQIGQDKFVDDLLKGRQNGFFVEVGAYDGESMSNTLFFERERNWTGLLIEANPYLFKKLQCRYRNAYVSNACLSTTPYAVALNFTFADYLTGQGIPQDKSLITGKGTVQCFPLLTYLMALNISRVDYFSLDIEGGEIDVLKQIDFQRIQIDVFTIEYTIKYHRSPESLANLKRMNDFLLGTGLYRQVQTIKDLDVVFMRNSL